MQKIWSKILAGEFKSPNSFSLKTLDFLKNLSKDEATLFIESAKCVFFYDGIGSFIITNENQTVDGLLKLKDILLLKEIGVLNVTHLSIEIKPEFENQYLLYDKGGILIRNVAREKITVPYLSFTRIGSELLKLVDFIPDFDYLNHAAKVIQRYSKAEVLYSTELKLENNKRYNVTPLQTLPIIK